MVDGVFTTEEPTWGLAGRFMWANIWRGSLVTTLLFVIVSISVALLSKQPVRPTIVAELVIAYPIIFYIFELVLLGVIGTWIYTRLLNKTYGHYRVTFLYPTSNGLVEATLGMRAPVLLALRFWWSNIWRLFFVVLLAVFIGVICGIVVGFLAVSVFHGHLPMMNVEFSIAMTIVFLIIGIVIQLRIFKKLLTKSYGRYQMVVHYKDEPALPAVTLPPTVIQSF